MNQEEQLTLEEGIDKILELARGVSSKPIFIGIYGSPNSGKSYLGSRLIHRFIEDGKITHTGVMTHGEVEPVEFLDDSDFAITEYLGTAESNLIWFDKEIMEKHGKKTDIKALIYNPNIGYSVAKKLHADLDLFDLVISNPDSKEKNPTK